MCDFFVCFKDADEAPNFRSGQGKKFMNYILKQRKYWYGTCVLRADEWSEIYWMDIGMQLKWLLLLRYQILNDYRKCLLCFVDGDQTIVDIILIMARGMSQMRTCFIS